MGDRSNTVEGFEGFLLSTLILLAIGILFLASGILLYVQYHDLKAQIDEQAERQGLGSIPGVNLEEQVRMAWLMIVMGAAALSAAMTVALVGLSRKHGLRKP